MIHTTSIYNGTLQLDFDDAEHRYIVREAGKPDLWPPGVTTILSVINKPALVPWAAKLTAETYSSLLRSRMAAGALLPADLAGMEKEAKGAPRAVAKEAAGIGSAVHAWAEAFAHGARPDLPADPRTRNGVEGFLSWCGAHAVEFVSTEVRVYSRAFHYAGTFDFLARVDGKLMLGDYKVSSGIYPEYYFQTAAYAQAYGEMTGETVRDRIVVCFDKRTGGVKTAVRSAGAQYINDFRGFQGAMHLHSALAAIGGGA